MTALTKSVSIPPELLARLQSTDASVQDDAITDLMALRLPAIPSKFYNLKDKNRLINAFDSAFVDIGGVQFLTQWAKDNPTNFYNLMQKMHASPLIVAAAGGGGTVVVNTSIPESALDNPQSVIDVDSNDVDLD